MAALENVTKAGAGLGYSQSAVSVQIRHLEQELGRPLFDRIGKNVYLTDFGRAAVPAAHPRVGADAVGSDGAAPEQGHHAADRGLPDGVEQRPGCRAGVIRAHDG